MSEENGSIDSSIGDVGTDTGIGKYEQLAREKGWRPKEEFEGPEELWVSAEEFVIRKPFMNKIKLQAKKLSELERTVDALAAHYQISLAQAKEKAIAELKAERREAIELGEAGKVDAIDARIDQVKQMPDPNIGTSKIPYEVEHFVEQNKEWFDVDEEMTLFAKTHNTEYLRKHPNDLGKSLEETMKAVRRAFPDKFANQRRSAPPPVESGTPPDRGGKSKYSVSMLNAEQKLVYEHLVKRRGEMSHEDYFKQLESAGYLEK